MIRCPRYIVPALLAVTLFTAPRAAGQIIYEQIKSFGFPELSGSSPIALIQGRAGDLFGVTGLGGASAGSIFVVKGSTDEYRVIHSFDNQGPRLPQAALAQ